MTPCIRTIWIEEAIRDHALTQPILDAQISSQEYTPAIRTFSGEFPEKEILSYDAGREMLVLRQAKGQVFRVCPGATTPDGKRIVCCNYHVLNFMSGCPYRCSYCYLQAYLNQPALSIQVNVDEVLTRWFDFFRQHPQQLFRVGTGEIADSLALPASDPINRFLVETFALEKNALLELKTKSNRIEHLLDLDSRGKVILSWSLSPAALSAREEHLAAPIVARLDAAEKALAAGYQIGFHLDPLLYAHANFEEWAKDYRVLLTLLFDRIPAKSMTWLSVGGLRLLKGLREIMMSRFPESRLAYQEFVPGIEGKWRYPKPLRREMFRFVSDEVKRLAGREAPPLYLCMETREIWDRALGSTPHARGDLHMIFNRSLPEALAI